MFVGFLEKQKTLDWIKMMFHSLLMPSAFQDLKSQLVMGIQD